MDPVEDVRVTARCPRRLAGRAVIQIDGNTGWSLWEAIWALREMEAIGGLGAVEQPVASRREMAVLAQDVPDADHGRRGDLCRARCDRRRA